MNWWLCLWLACAPAVETPAAPVVAEAEEPRPLPEGWLEEVRGGEVDERLPMVVVVHGLGDRPQSMLSLMSGLEGPVRIVAPRAPTSWGKGYAWFTVRAASGEREELASQMQREAAALAEQIREVTAARPTEGKPVLTGFSQGGMLSFMVAAHHPEVIRKAVPVAGWLPEEVLPTEAAGVPIVALHGDADPVLPLEPTRGSVDALRALGSDVQLQVFPGVEHRIPPAVRQALYEAVSR
jgi:phospholipase/carboxylesterase